MPEEDDDTLQKLLRLKRHEQPPPEYFEKFLREFQFRQRSEMLRRPAWRIAIDRLEALLSHLTFSRLSYAGASAAVLLVAGGVTFDMLQHPGGEGRALVVAQNINGVGVSNMSNTPGFSNASLAPALVSTADQFSLSPQIRVPGAFPNDAIQPEQTRLHPRYVLDSRPVSYEPPFSF